MAEPLPEDLAAALRATVTRRGVFGHRLVYFTDVGSTNDVACRLADAGAEEGTTVVASYPDYATVNQAGFTNCIGHFAQAVRTGGPIASV